MATNKLMEAAADILSGSKSRAPGMPSQKLDGANYVDVGGPTPENYKPDDNSAKLNTTRAARSATAPTTKPSDASSDTQNHVGKNTMREEDEEFEDDEDQEQLDEISTKTLASAARSAADPDSDYEYGKSHDPQKFADHAKKTKDAKSAAAVQGAADSKGANRLGHTYGDSDKMKYRENRSTNPSMVTKAGKLTKTAQKGLKSRLKEDEQYDQEEYSLIDELRAQMHDDIQALFAEDTTISEDFKIKAATIFEARVFDRVAQIEEQIESEYAGMLEEAIDAIKSDLTEKVDDYLNYVVDQWINDNEIAIESGLRSEITEDFIGGLRNLFAENYINVPEEKVDLIDELASKVEELETQLNEEIETNIEYKKALVEAVKSELTREVCEGLTATQVEKIRTLAESVEFSTEEEYTEKLETLRENYFPSGVKKSAITHFNEVMEDADDKKVAIHDPFVAAVSNAISKTRI